MTLPPGEAGAAAPRSQAMHAALAACRSSLATAGVFSVFINLLMLVPVVYMLQIYDRVLSSGSEPTLVMLTLIVVFLFAVLGTLEWLRAQVMIMVSTKLDASLGKTVYGAIFARAWAGGGRAGSAQPLSDLHQVRGFLTGPGLFAFLDAPWLPLYLGVMFILHPVLGWAGVAAALVLVALAFWAEAATGGTLREAGQVAARAEQETQTNLRNVEAVAAMGMLPRLCERWQRTHLGAIALQHQASRRAGLISALSRTLRMSIQSLILGLGAWLALRNEVSAGVVIGGSILLGRALAPIDQVIAHWRSFVNARAAYARLNDLLRQPMAEAPMALPAPLGAVKFEQVVVQPAGARKPLLNELSFSLEAGQQLAVIGPSAAGKSTLLRALLGLHTPVSGTVTLDGAELAQYDRTGLGAHLGYLPQGVELLPGSVAENIARFGPIDAPAVVSAAMAAGVHNLILALPEGYGTRVEGPALSAGQRQRIALARAVYGQPRLVLLDEPNSNLDEEGDAALLHTLGELRRWGSTVVVVTHRTNILQQVDRVLLLVQGKLALFGTREQVSGALQQAASRTTVAARRAAGGLSVAE